MSPRDRAIDVLRRARDMLADRLAQRVLELREEILEDAAGFSLDGEIDSLHEEISGRLARLNQMLANLPPETPAERAANSPVATGAPCGSGNLAASDAAGEESRTSGPAPVFLALPAPQPARNSAFAILARHDASEHARAADLAAISAWMADLLIASPATARRAIRHFAEQLGRDPSVLAKARQLRVCMEERNLPRAAVLLKQVFGIRGVDSIKVLGAFESSESAD